MPGFRKQGFGRKIAVKCLLDGTVAFLGMGDDWVHTDVASDNVASVRLFQGLGAELAWSAYWMRIDLTMI